MELKKGAILVILLFTCMCLAGVAPRLMRANVVEVVQGVAIPVQPQITGTPAAQGEVPELGSFIGTVTNGQPNTIVGVWVPGKLALPVGQQPARDPTFVTTEANMVTQFGLPADYGVVALLAHNYLGGKQFTFMNEGDGIALVYGDGQVAYYRVRQIVGFQALKPYSPYSDFIDLADPSGQVISSATLFTRIYTASGRLVFQTCIDAHGDPSWGRQFWIAEPIPAP